MINSNTDYFQTQPRYNTRTIIQDLVSVTSTLANVNCDALKFQAHVGKIMFSKFTVQFPAHDSPETNLRLTSETLQPAPASSNSTPLRVVPSQLNCAAMVPWHPGPEDSWNLALELRQLHNQIGFITIHRFSQSRRRLPIGPSRAEQGRAFSVIVETDGWFAALIVTRWIVCMLRGRQ